MPVPSLDKGGGEAAEGQSPQLWIKQTITKTTRHKQLATPRGHPSATNSTRAKWLKATENPSPMPLDGNMKFHGETFTTHGADRMRYTRSNLKFSTYNVRTLHQTGKFHQLTTGSKKANLDVIGIQEHRLTTKSEIDYLWDSDKEYMMAYSTADKRRIGGVGILINKKTRISSKICRQNNRQNHTGELQGQPRRKHN